MQSILSGRNETSQIHGEEQSEETIETRAGGMGQRLTSKAQQSTPQGEVG